MDLGCIEVIVPKKDNQGMKVLQVILCIICGIFVLLGLITINLLILILAIGSGIGLFFVSRELNLEYEYSYVEKELRVAKIHKKSTRREAGQFDLEKAQICAPIHSYRLDNYKNKQLKTLDFSSGIEKKPDPRYVMYMAEQKVIFEPDDELIAALRQGAPSKVFRD